VNNLQSPAENDARKISLFVVHGVLEKGAYANILLDRYLRTSHLSTEDRHLTTEIVNGTIRMLKHLDWVLNLFLQKPVSVQNPWLRNVLRISLYQMLFMEKIPDYAIVNSAVELVRDKAGGKLAGVANGVLRNLARNRAAISYPEDVDSCQYLAVFYSQPEWLVQKWLSEYGIDVVRAMLIYFNQRPGLVLRNNELRGTRDELIAELSLDGVYCRPSPRTPWGLVVEGLDKSLEKLQAYQAGRFYVQNEASMLAVSILAAQPGENIIDLCSGVGGKASFMAEQMRNCGIIEAYELYQHKLALLALNCGRLGISIVEAHQQDILALPSDLDRAAGVLLDAPCSGLGVLNRRADSRWKKTPDNIAELRQLQASLLEKGGQLVILGGRLIYSTCTINQAENQDIVLEFLQNNPNYALEGFAGEISYFPLDDQDQHSAAAGMLTLLPGKYQTDGMFYARMRRSCNE
jgi:16S rRNA (cytosine967-C5)-methyltransferase